MPWLKGSSWVSKSAVVGDSLDPPVLAARCAALAFAICARKPAEDLLGSRAFFGVMFPVGDSESVGELSRFGFLVVDTAFEDLDAGFCWAPLAGRAGGPRVEIGRCLGPARLLPPRALGIVRGVLMTDAGRMAILGVLSTRLCGDATEGVVDVTFGSPELTVRLAGVDGVPEIPGRFTGDCGRLNDPAFLVEVCCWTVVLCPAADSGRDEDEGREDVMGLAGLKKLDSRLHTAGDGGILERLSTVLSDSEGLGGLFAVRTGDAATLSERSVDTSLSSGLGPSSYAFSC